MNIKALIIPALALLIFPSTVQASSGGTSTAQTYKISPSPRAAAMGETFSSFGADMTSLFYNPSAAGYADRMGAAFSHSSLFGEVSYNFLSFSKELRDEKGGYALSVAWLDSGAIPLTQASSRGLYTGTDGSFNATSLLAAITGGARIGDNCRLGMTLKYLKETIAVYGSDNIAADLGVTYGFLNDRMRFNLSILNNSLGKIKFINEESVAPRTNRFGLEGRVTKTFILACEMEKVFDGDAKLHYGAEFELKGLLLRAGYNPASGENTGTGVTAGLGLKHKDLFFDYAFLPAGDLGVTQKLSVGLKFGEDPSSDIEPSEWWQ